MRSPNIPPYDLSGSLLIAHPSLTDPNFRRSVIFVVTHSEEGAMGLVLTNRTNKAVSDYLEAPGLGLLADMPVRQGGPVALDKMLFARLLWDGDKEQVQCETAFDITDANLLGEDAFKSVGAFVGYSGWGAGQLEAEIQEHHSWFVQKAEQDILDPRRWDNLWKKILEEQGPWFKLLASAPEDPSRN